MKRLIGFFILSILLFNCKSLVKQDNLGGFKIDNNSDKIIEFLWLTPEGDFYPIAKSIEVGKGETFEVEGLESGLYDIAIDFKNEYNSFNSKKDKSLCLKVEKGLKTVWSVDEAGNIIKE